MEKINAKIQEVRNRKKINLPTPETSDEELKELSTTIGTNDEEDNSLKEFFTKIENKFDNLFKKDDNKPDNPENQEKNLPKKEEQKPKKPPQTKIHRKITPELELEELKLKNQAQEQEMEKLLVKNKMQKREMEKLIRANAEYIVKIEHWKSLVSEYRVMLDEKKQMERLKFERVCEKLRGKEVKEQK